MTEGAWDPLSLCSYSMPSKSHYPNWFSVRSKVGNLSDLAKHFGKNTILKPWVEPDVGPRTRHSPCLHLFTVELWSYCMGWTMETAWKCEEGKTVKNQMFITVAAAPCRQAENSPPTRQWWAGAVCIRCQLWPPLLHRGTASNQNSEHKGRTRTLPWCFLHFHE